MQKLWVSMYKCDTTRYPRRRQESGLSMNTTEKIVGVTTKSVMRWVHRFISEKPDISVVTEAKMDKMYH